MTRTPALLGALALGVLAFGSSANASTVVNLNTISSGTIGTGTLGTVTLTQNGANEVDVVVALAANTQFVATGGPHNAFAFNLDLLSGYTVTVTSPLNSFAVNGSGTNTPYGSFTQTIDCTACGSGGSNPNPGPLDFKVVDLSGITIADFTKNTDGYYFSADVLGPNGGTGNIAGNTETTTGGGGQDTTPLPGAIWLFGTILAGAGGFQTLRGRRKERKVAFAAA
jgi:hypothetical protein